MFSLRKSGISSPFCLSGSHPQPQTKSGQGGLLPGGVSLSPMREFGVPLRQHNFGLDYGFRCDSFYLQTMLDDTRRCSLQSIIQSQRAKIEGKLPFFLVVYLPKVCLPESLGYWDPGFVHLPWYLSVKFVVLPLSLHDLGLQFISLSFRFLLCMMGVVMSVLLA